MPEARRAALNKFSIIEVPESAVGNTVFSRAELAAALGGGTQSVDGRHVCFITSLAKSTSRSNA